jgi:hypothetical protein
VASKSRGEESPRVLKLQQAVGWEGGLLKRGVWAHLGVARKLRRGTPRFGWMEKLLKLPAISSTTVESAWKPSGG